MFNNRLFNPKKKAIVLHKKDIFAMMKRNKKNTRNDDIGLDSSRKIF